MDQKQFVEQAVDQKEKEIVELSDKIFDMRRSVSMNFALQSYISRCWRQKAFQ